MEPHERLRVLREKRGYETQKKFVHHANQYGYEVSLRRYSAIERGQEKPNISEIMDICKAMKIGADAWLFGDDRRVDLSGLDSDEVEIVAGLAESLRRLRR